MRLDDDGDTRLEDVIEDTAASPFADDGFVSVEDVLDCLNERERTVIQLRYGICRWWGLYAKRSCRCVGSSSFDGADD